MKNRRSEREQMQAVESLLRAAAHVENGEREPAADFVGRALRRVTKQQKRGGVGFGWAVVSAAAGVVIFGYLGSRRLPPLPPSLPVSALVPRFVPSREGGEAVRSREFVSLVESTPPPSLEGTKRGTSAETGREGGRGGRDPKTLISHRRHHRRSLATPTHLAIVAPQPEPILPPQAAVTAPLPTAKPRPFWHDEQVERDDYAVYAPVVVAEGTGRELTSLTPAVVQVSFSTTQPVADALRDIDDLTP